MRRTSSGHWWRCMDSTAYRARVRFLVENIPIYFSDNSLQCGYPPLLPSTGLRSRTFH